MTVCRVYCVGETSPWAKELLSALQAAGVADFIAEPSPQRFCETVFAPAQVPIAFLENSPDSQKSLLQLRQCGKRMFLVWFGKQFSKEDLQFAVDHRIYAAFESPRPQDENLIGTLQKLTENAGNAEQFERLIHSFKALLLQASGEDALKPLIGELKTAIGKLEKTARDNEFTGGETTASGDAKLPFSKTEHLGDALGTVHDLERTGTLWVRGNLPGQEGKIDFLQGKMVSAQTGEARGLKGIYRMFLWDEPQYLFNRRESKDMLLEEQINETMKVICDEGENLRRRFASFRQELPPADLKLELEPTSLNAGNRLSLHEFSTLASVIELGKVSQIIDYNPLPDVVLYESLIRLKKANVIRVAA